MAMCKRLVAMIVPVAMMAAGVLTTPAASLAQGTVEYYHLDALGSVRAVTDAAGAVIERHDYMPFGDECTIGPCALNPGLGVGQPRTFAGKELDSETGLDYFEARHLATAAGRFTTQDPVYVSAANIIDPQRWNRYSYARGNPCRYVDPDGRTFIDYLLGIYNAGTSNFQLGIGRLDYDNADYRYGQRVGDSISVFLGGLEMAAAAGMVDAGGTLTVSVAGAEIGLPVAGAGLAVAAHGSSGVAIATGHLSENTKGSGGGANPRPEAKYLGSKKHGLTWTEGPAEARKTGKPQGQWGSQADLDFAGEKAGELWPMQSGTFDLPEGSQSVVHRPDGSTVPAKRIWVRNNGVGTFHGYPTE
jgi:RHS repeat-associated protein